jgi:hypothetical protein
VAFHIINWHDSGRYWSMQAGYTWTDYRTNTQIAKELKRTPILDK